MKIVLEAITPRQKLKIIKGLYDYQYIMENWQTDDADFQKVYFDFYLKARWAVMGKEKNSGPYFELLRSIDPEVDLMEILLDLKRKTETDSYEFSLGSKLLHTRNPSMPIYDSTVRGYLFSEEDVKFWWYIPQKISGAPRGTPEFEKIKHDWGQLRNWYDSFLSLPRGKEWIGWFDNTFPAFSGISNIKKVDFIIYGTN